MKFTIQLLIEDPGKLPLCVPIQTIERECERIEAVGLRLNEAKSLLGQLQQHVVRVQISDYLQAHRCCDQCGQPRRVKGYHPMRFRTALGDLSLRSPRWRRCDCEPADAPASFSPLKQLLTTHTAPELEYLQAKWAAHVSFAAVAALLHDVLPIDPGLHGEGVRAHVLATVERLDAELGPEQFAFDGGCQRDIEASPAPGPPITVGLDGG